MGAVVDTSWLVDLERAGTAVGDVAEPGWCVAAITVSELLHGAVRADTEERRARRTAFAEGVAVWLPVIDFDLLVARHYAGVWAAVARAGTPVGAHDLMIAATAQVLGLPVLTRNQRHFESIPGTDVRP